MGSPIFGKAMSGNMYKELMRRLRFDNFSTRRDRRETNKFCLISETWEDFIENCKRCYVPSFDLTIDEQLFPCKTQCPFTQFMPKKPDKFGIKFWLLVDAISNTYVTVNLILEKTQQEPGKMIYPPMSAYGLMQPNVKKGYNVTMDNFLLAQI